MIKTRARGQHVEISSPRGKPERANGIRTHLGGIASVGTSVDGHPEGLGSSAVGFTGVRGASEGDEGKRGNGGEARHSDGFQVLLLAELCDVCDCCAEVWKK